MTFSSNDRNRSVTRLLCGASLSAIAMTIAGQAYAQEAAPAESVTVTGTIIKGINPIGANLLTVDSSDIRAIGAMTTDEVLGQIPQLANTFNSVPVEPTQINIGAVRPVIRYIPSQAIVGGSETLVLLNGQNMVGISGLATAPDPGMIPTVVLGRVDVLPDGASSVYGANAITGVINFVTRPSYDGLQISAEGGAADGYTSFDASAIGGTSWSSGNAYLAYEHKSNSYLMASDRSYTNMNLLSVGGRDSRDTACALPNINVGSTYYAEKALPNGSPGSLAANISGPLAAPDPITNAGQINRCDSNSYQALYPKQEQNSVFGSMHQKIANGIDFDATVLWSNRLDSQLQPVSSVSATIDNSNPYFQSIAGETQQNVQFSFAPFLGSNSRVNMNDSEVFQFTPKVTVQLPFKDWELVARFSQIEG
jgi:iron complex outermembrane receptor protein